MEKDQITFQPQLLICIDTHFIVVQKTLNFSQDEASYSETMQFENVVLYIKFHSCHVTYYQFNFVVIPLGHSVGLMLRSSFCTSCFATVWNKNIVLATSLNMGAFCYLTFYNLHKVWKKNVAIVALKHSDNSCNNVSAILLLQCTGRPRQDDNVYIIYLLLNVNSNWYFQHYFYTNMP